MTTDTHRTPVLGAEGAIFFAAALALIALQLTVMNAGVLLTRPLWLDEIHTVLVAGAPTVSALISRLASGVDFNLPAAYLLYRFVGELTGGLAEATLRVVAAVSVAGALTAVFILLRDRYAPWSAAAGTLAVWAQPVVVNAAFEVRFYGPWLLATGCLLLGLRRAVQRPPTGLSAVSLALASVATCTVHYFGVLAWLAGTGVVAANRRHELAEIARRLAPSLAGPLVLAACIPLYLDQRAALSVPTWIPTVSSSGVLFLLGVLLLPPSTIAAIICLAVARRPSARLAPPLRSDDTSSLGPSLLVGQAAVPVILAIVSLFGEPFTQPRYWIVGSLAAAPVAALAVSRCGRALASVVVAVTVAWSITAVRGERAAAERFRGRVAEDVDITTRLSRSGKLVVFRRRHTLYPVWRARPELAANVALLDATAVHPDDRFLVVERDVARVHLRQFGFPQIRTTNELAEVDSFYVVELYTDRAPTPEEFPGRVIRPVASRVFSVSRD